MYSMPSGGGSGYIYFYAEDLQLELIFFQSVSDSYISKVLVSGRTKGHLRLDVAVVVVFEDEAELFEPCGNGL